MDQLATLWAVLPDWVLEAASRARALPYPALHVMAGALVLALLARSLAALTLAMLLVSIAAIVVLAHPADQRSWTILWTSCAASLLGTALAFHRQRLARRVSILREKVSDLNAELADLRPRYERELIWRHAAERHTLEAPEPILSPPVADLAPPQAAVGRLGSTWQTGPHRT
jgi:hypothetical protein